PHLYDQGWDLHRRPHGHRHRWGDHDDVRHPDDPVMTRIANSLRGRWQQGQALVEFSLSIIIFIVMLMGIFDVGRAIFMYNGVSEAARDIARRTSVYPYSGIGGSNYLG